MNTCDSIQNVWDDYRDGGLAAADAAEVRRHLQSCGRCGELYRRETRMLETLAEPAVVEGGEAFVQNVVAAWRKQPSETARRGVLFRIGPLLAIAATLLVAASAAVIILRGEPQQRGESPATVAMNEAEDPVSVLMKDLSAGMDERPAAVRSAIAQTSSFFDLDRLVDMIERSPSGS